MSTAPSRIARQSLKAPIRIIYNKNEIAAPLPIQVKDYPEFRYMGSKNRLLPWLHSVLDPLDFETAADPFSGSGCVGYLLKAMGRKVIASDFLNFSATIAQATIANSHEQLDGPALKRILYPIKNAPNFIEKTFGGIFFRPEDLRFLDRLSHNIEKLESPHQQALARTALIRSCLKKQPRGVYTIAGNRYDDGRRDLKLSIEEHFLEQVEKFNRVVFDNGRRHTVKRADMFDLRPRGVDLVYLDPPYVPRSDDNCYIKRYHFLEGLSCYWRGLDIMQETKVKKVQKRFTPFSYRRTAVDAFDRMFRLYRNSIIVLSYSSNGYPDLEVLENLMRRYKKDVATYEKPHRYHFGTHKGVERAEVQEYLLVGR
jgi:DNA adenine methylase/adenine-specific DNA-methyltransferase